MICRKSNRVVYWSRILFYRIRIFTGQKREHRSSSTDRPLLLIQRGVFYTIHRIKQLYPHYIFSFITAFIWFGIIRQYTILEYVKCFYASLSEVVLLSMSGLNLKSMINVPAWYLSDLVIAGYFLYTLLRNYKAAFLYLLAPLAVLIIYTYFYRYVGCIQYSALGEGVVKGIYGNFPLLRGIADMSVGILLYYLQADKGGIRIWDKLSGKAVFILEFLCYGFVIATSYFYSRTSLDFLYIVILSIAVSISYFHKINMGAKYYRFLEYGARLCYPMFLNHNMFRKLLPQFVLELSGGLVLLYLITVTLYSMATMAVVDKTVDRIKNRRDL